MSPLGIPGLRVISDQFSPPSVDLYRPLSSPPDDKLPDVRKTSEIDATIPLGFSGSKLKSPAPALSLLNNTFFQDLPPSVDLKTPRSSFLPYGWPSAAT